MVRKFLLTDVLSVVMDKPVSASHYHGMWDLLNFVTENDLPANQLPSARSRCREYILSSYPELKIATEENSGSDNYKEVLEKLRENFGEHLELESIQKPKERVVEQFGVRIGGSL